MMCLAEREVTAIASGYLTLTDQQISTFLSKAGHTADELASFLITHWNISGLMISLKEAYILARPEEDSDEPG